MSMMWLILFAWMSEMNLIKLRSLCPTVKIISGIPYYNKNWSEIANFLEKQGIILLNKPGQPVSRILSGGNPAWMDIYLG